MKSPIVCRCEEISLEEIIKIAKKYKGSARELKLRTRVGMGYCGGRVCRPMVESLLNNNEHLKEIPQDPIPLKVQPPVRPISLSQLGGKDDGT